jgi:hypothetical protein
MNEKKKKLLAYKMEYLKLAYIITCIRLLGEEPPEKLIKEAQFVRLVAQYSKDEFANL